MWPSRSTFQWRHSSTCYEIYTPEIVIEFPHADDPMVKRLLLNKRDGIHSDYQLGRIRAPLG